MKNLYTEIESGSFLNPSTQANSFPDQQVPEDPQNALDCQDANDFSLALLRRRVPDEEVEFFGHNNWQDIFDQPHDLSYNSDQGQLGLMQQNNSIAKEKQNQLSKYQWSTGKLVAEASHAAPIECARRNLEDAFAMTDMTEVQTAAHSALTRQQPDSALSRMPGKYRMPISKPERGSLNMKMLMSSQPKSTVKAFDASEKATAQPVSNFPCKFCSRTFSSQQSLGGHTSKMHPGLSENYKLKQQKRAEMDYDREMRKKAQVYFTELVGCDFKLFSAKITLIKKILISLDNNPTAESEAQFRGQLEDVVDTARALALKSGKL